MVNSINKLITNKKQNTQCQNSKLANNQQKPAVDKFNKNFQSTKAVRVELILVRYEVILGQYFSAIFGNDSINNLENRLHFAAIGANWFL